MVQADQRPGEPVRGEVTRLLAASREGDQQASARLFELVYDDLRRLAARRLRDHHGPTTTSLVHDAFLRLDRDGGLPYSDRAHFFATAARAMRQIVIDDARGRQAQKRGGGRADLDLDAIAVAAPAIGTPVEDLLALDAALVKLEAEDARLAQVVEWHFFGGLTLTEIAEVQNMSRRTVQRDWRAARALLHLELAGSAPPA